MSVSRRLPRALLTACAVVACLLGLPGPAPAAAAGAAVACTDATLVFARGSGQPLGAGEVTRFFSASLAALAARPVGTYELGTHAQGAARYPAVGVGTDSTEAFLTMIGADLSWTGLGSYRASVAQGVAETAAYLSARSALCPGERFVLSGYSQGAHVIGDALAGLAPALRARVAYVALFGDPKLHLPEGKGIVPPACRGGSRSPWRRGSAGCLVDSGILEARVPYVPADLAGRVGSWCDSGDAVCTNNLAAFRNTAHSAYDLPGKGVDQAATEIAAALAR
ncbi:cutinase family protein [Motilibacter aurantiacus]|uniref:cutinase family protein n=1 Tax=Motilibacter aurantiacus TaxID=2714955 RepID=UPI001408B47D|nr:cutinase family protein [Motilibacter aurantiacus]NHC44483.1 cutinase family protein [Motilibacter aurantiacus]